ncbi:Serine/threonine phosphoprotein phosphatase [Paraburkholderia ribeironis]|uniref:Serine/threonine phosphoprotein phosphatase n=2 Tax=Paraburkholderia ribeironis TaxID=1247936 RepID=A0A1N7SD85_9BURK|nr:Serine/threonine phosphoprotein phosphatase [Paraburkholderia ribeironis]
MVVEALDQNGARHLIAIAADGAGSARFAQAGAELTCETAVLAVTDLLAQSADGVQSVKPRAIIEAVRGAILERATEGGASLRDFACTVVGAVVGPEKVLYFQIGDGAIVARRTDALKCIFWPDGGEYANTTFFITDHDAQAHLQSRIDDTPEELALMTDGLQRLALVFSSKAVHAPFFDPMFAVLRTASEEECDQLSGSLAAFLDSEPVNSRTDDDKTLVLVSGQREAEV